MTGLSDLTASDLCECYRRGEATPTEVMCALLQRIDAEVSHLHAYLSLDWEGALAEARQWDRAARASDGPTLVGIPVVLKDNLCTRG